MVDCRRGIFQRPPPNGSRPAVEWGLRRSPLSVVLAFGFCATCLLLVAAAFPYVHQDPSRRPSPPGPARRQPAVTADASSSAQASREGAAAAGGCYCEHYCPGNPSAWVPDFTPAEVNESLHRRSYEFDCPLRDRCSGGGVGLLAVVVVPSAPGNVDRRDAIRSTWASEARARSINVVFLVGLSSDAVVRRALDDESRRTGDLVLANFADSYDLLTVKSVAMLRWASTHCRSARYLVKADDDMFVSLPHLSRVLNSNAGISRVVIGHRRDHLHVISGAKQKWRNPFYLRHYGDTYPTYMSGTTYALGMAIVPELFAATQAEPFDRMEDVFVTGICARRIGNVQHIMDFGFVPQRRRACEFASDRVVTAHEIQPATMRSMWSEIQQGRRTGCG